MSSLPSEDAKQPENSYVLDASALLAVVLQEPGGDIVEDFLRAGACVSAVNVSESLARLHDMGFSIQRAEDAIGEVECAIIDFNEATAVLAGRLRPATRRHGLGLGDRACLALAAYLTLPAVTADRIWASLDVGVEIVLCR